MRRHLVGLFTHGPSIVHCQRIGALTGTSVWRHALCAPGSRSSGLPLAALRIEGEGEPMQGSIHVGSIAGIRIDINYGWLIILVLATISLGAGWFPEAIQGLSPGVYYILGFS